MKFDAKITRKVGSSFKVSKYSIFSKCPIVSYNLALRISDQEHVWGVGCLDVLMMDDVFIQYESLVLTIDQ